MRGTSLLSCPHSVSGSQAGETLLGALDPEEEEELAGGQR